MAARWLLAVVTIAAVVACGAPTPGPDGAGGDDEVALPDPPRDDEAPDDDTRPDGAGEADDWVPVLDVTVYGDATVGDPSLFWTFVPPAMAMMLGREVHGQEVGVATLWSTAGEPLAEAPVEESAHVGDCDPDAGPCESYHVVVYGATLAVPEGAEQAARLTVDVDGVGTVAEVARDDDVRFEDVDAPPAGGLEPPATVRWRASGGRVSARLVDPLAVLVMDTEPQGELTLGQEQLFTPPGSLLELVVLDGLAFDRVVVGPYHLADGVPVEVGWEVLFDGEPVEEVSELTDLDGLNYLLADVTVLVRLPGENTWGTPPGLRATWRSDRDGDLSDRNLDPAPLLYVPLADLTPGVRVLTLELEVDLTDGSTAAHEVDLTVHVPDPLG